MRKLTQGIGAVAVSAMLLSGCSESDFDLESLSEGENTPASEEVEEASAAEDEGSGDDEAQEASSDVDSQGLDSDNPMVNDLTLTDASEAESLLGDLDVGSNSMAGYEKDTHYPTWYSASTNGWDGYDLPDGCNVREAVLIRDAEEVEVEEDCTVTSGVWIDPYEGFEITEPSDIDIEHIVSTSGHWAAGGTDMTQDERTEFAHSPIVLVVSHYSTNRSKGDQGPESWTPDEESKCLYALRWIEIKDTYDLPLLSEDERGALGEFLDTCEV